VDSGKTFCQSHHPKCRVLAPLPCPVRSLVRPVPGEALAVLLVCRPQWDDSAMQGD
jgi:hypothetical protein